MGRSKKEKRQADKVPSFFWLEVKRDIETFKRLKGFAKLKFVMDYFKWYILAAIFIIFTIGTFANLLYQGHKPVRLDVCCVLNTEETDASPWFKNFETELLKDGITNHGGVRVDYDQPFDYDNSYYYIMELEVQTKVSSRRIDVAVCNADMYKYLLAINAGYDLKEVLPEEDIKALEKNKQLVYDTAGIRINEDGSLDKTDAEDGYFAIDLTKSEFGQKYNTKGGNKDHLYVMIIKNAKHVEDSIKLVQDIYK
ncbi:MAG: hypothetical protein MJ087_00685 [Lachnospiraceae bacterium]|nr:hypothetical protein [Lachnospiraceae bacterium]